MKIICTNPSDLSVNRTYISLIDTGAQETCISDKIIKELGLVPSGKTVDVIDSMGKRVTSDRYYCYFQFEGLSKTYNLYSTKLHRRNIDLIIGMDILENLKITIENFEITLNDN
jgi:predicted aspartyl protease